MGYLYLIRHGESRWNASNKFTGWVDVPLSEKGIREAILTARHFKKLRLDVAFTSHLERAHETLLIILSKQHCTGIFVHENEHHKLGYSFKIKEHEVFVHTSWVLNERHYGVLQGMDKDQIAKQYGYNKVFAWRREFKSRPPKGESLNDVYNRVVRYFKQKIWPEIQKNKNIWVVAHGNTLRALIKYIDNISDEKIAFLNLKPAQPVIYKFRAGKLEKITGKHFFNRPIFWK